MSQVSTTSSPVPVEKKKPISSLAQIKELEQDPKLLELCARHLPPNYDFEIAKTVWRIRKTSNCHTVALQMPEGLLLFATKVANVLTELTGVETILMGDVTYGACCIDDFTASMLGAQLLVHYGHSCLVPTTVASRIETIYIFVTISYNIEHAVESIGNLIKERINNDMNNENGFDKNKRRHIKIAEEAVGESTDSSIFHVSLVSTIQFANSLAVVKQALENQESIQGNKIQVTIPRSKPLSNGEILGCTAPTVKDDLIVYVGDGRFHLEAMMMANPTIDAYRYDPYNKTLTLELFDHNALHQVRGQELKVLQNTAHRLTIGIILGTLGRQGNPRPLEYVYQKLVAMHNCFVVLMSEVMPAKLSLFHGVDCWVQFACPRLSIDWGSAFSVPILTPYEAIWGLETSINNLNQDCQENSILCKENNGDGACCKNQDQSKECCGKKQCSNSYAGHPMDYYAYDSLGPHTPNFMPPTANKSKVRASVGVAKKIC